MRKKSNNQKKPEWYCATSRPNLLRLIRGIELLGIFDTLKPPEAFIEFAENDILEFCNRECRAVKIKNK